MRHKSVPLISLIAFVLSQQLPPQQIRHTVRQSIRNAPETQRTEHYFCTRFAYGFLFAQKGLKQQRFSIVTPCL
ncbi:hypothetical protein ATANTOWER_021507 [Ataeniobius toweri]|uniref:Secreted protein n=1 Tax=Ataeniobius toweri TaxID=208326 RepID=A0ABU7CI04_9TELE|nr:hypothetical protein [Ataeniobius toweri]